MVHPVGPRLVGTHLRPHIRRAGDQGQADLLKTVARGVGQGPNASGNKRPTNSNKRPTTLVSMRKIRSWISYGQLLRANCTDWATALAWGCSPSRRLMGRRHKRKAGRRAQKRPKTELTRETSEQTLHKTPWPHLSQDLEMHEPCTTRAFCFSGTWESCQISYLGWSARSVS